MAVKLLGDLSASGNATFNSEVNLPSGGQIDWANGDARIIEGDVSNYSLSFQTYTGSALTTKMFVSSGGNVGIGTTAPTSNLEIVGNGGTVLDVQGSVGQLFSVTDSLTGDLFAVSDISGVPILNVNSSGAVDIDGTLTIDGDFQISEKIIHSGDANTYIQFPGTNDKIVFATNGSDALTLDASNAATFAGNIALTGGGTIEAPSVNGSETLNLIAAGGINLEIDSNGNSGDDQFFKIYKHSIGGTALFTVKETGDATFAGAVTTGGKLYIGSTDATATATTALLLGAAGEVKKRALGSNAFSSTSFAPLASPALTGTPTAPTAGATINTTQLATTAFVQTAISNLVDSSPSTLNTLNELAAALGDDASFSTTMTTALGNRLRVDTASQGLNATQKSNGRTNLGLGSIATSNAGDFASSYVDSVPDTTWSSTRDSQWKFGGWDANGKNWTPDTGWWWGLTLPHASNTSSYNYGGQLAIRNTTTADLYVRSISNGTSNDWKQVWSSANFANNSANWNTAYGWGDHASAGYLTAETFSSSDVVMSLSGTDVIAGESITLAGGLSYSGTTLTSANDNTTYTAGTGLTLSGTQFSVTANTYATAAQGTKADTAHGWGNHASANYINRTEPNEPFNPFGGQKFHDGVLTNALVGRHDRFVVTIDGTTEAGASLKLSNQNFEEYNQNRLFGTSAGETKVFNINVQSLATGSPNSNGITYSSGFFDINFYSSPFPASWSARVKNRDGNWTTVSSLTKIGNSKLRGVIPIGNYLTDIEFTLTARTSAPFVTGNITYGISEFELFFGRMTASQGGNISSIGGYLGGVITTASGTTSNNWNTAYGWGDHGLSAQDKTDISNLSGTNTGDQSIASIKTGIGTGNGKLVPAAGTAGHFLKHDGTFGIPAYTTNTDTVYTHPTSAGNKHIPTGGAAGQFLKYSSSGTAVWAAPSYTTNTDTQLSDSYVRGLFSGGTNVTVAANGTISSVNTTYSTSDFDAAGSADAVQSNLDTIATNVAGISNQSNTDVDTGTETIATVSTGTYTAAFFDFVIKNGTNVRAGTVYSCHDGTNVEFTETSTVDLGDTSDVTLSVDKSGTSMRLRATTTSNNWSVKSLVRAI